MFSLLALLDDVAATLDDVSIMTKVALKKTSALMSDDLAVNAGVVVGANPDRELPIVKGIFLGSLLNKVYCVIGVIAIQAVYPPLIIAILFLGGLYLSYEGAHKVWEKLSHKADDAKKKKKALSEKEKIKGAVRTDLILSIEIIVIAKTATSGGLLQQAGVLALVGLAASALIYGLVAFLVKIDDFGLFLVRKGKEKVGMALVQAMPFFMKALGVIGTLAMLLVGGGIVSHTFHLHNYIWEYAQNLILGAGTGLVVMAIIWIFQSIRRPSPQE